MNSSDWWADDSRPEFDEMRALFNGEFKLRCLNCNFEKILTATAYVLKRRNKNKERLRRNKNMKIDLANRR